MIPDGVKLLNMIGFIAADKRGGDFYNQPVTLSMEHGFTYGGDGGKAFALNQAIASASENAQIRGYEMILRSYISVGAISRSGNKNSFVQESKHLVQNMLKSFVRRLEVQMLYGQSANGLGKIETVTSGDPSITLEVEEWAAGIWSGAENMRIQIYSSALALRGEATITKVDFDLRKIYVDALPAGVVATDGIFYAGAQGKEFAGIHKILTNTGTLFNISAADYSLWKGNSVDVGTDFAGNESVLSFAKIEEAIARQMEKGLGEEKVCVLCNPKSWKNLLTEQDAKRRYDSSYSGDSKKAGAKEIMFYGPNGDIEIKSSIFCKEGFAYVLSLDCFERVGSSDVRFDQPGFEGKFVKLLENVNAYEMRSYTDQALFCTAPGQNSVLRFIKS